MSYRRQVANGRRLLEAVARAELEHSEAGWALAELTSDVTATVPLKQWAADIGSSESHVSRLRTVWRRYAERRHVLRFQDAYSLSGSGAERAEAIEEEATRAGASVEAVRVRAVKGQVKLPPSRRRPAGKVLTSLYLARHHLRLALQEAKVAPGAAGETAAIVAEEIREVAVELVNALLTPVSLVG